MKRKKANPETNINVLITLLTFFVIILSVVMQINNF